MTSITDPTTPPLRGPAALPLAEREKETRRAVWAVLHDRLPQIGIDTFTGLLLVTGHWPSKTIMMIDDSLSPWPLALTVNRGAENKTLETAVDDFVQRVYREFEFSANFYGKITLYISIDRGIVINHACTSEKSYK